MDTLAPQRRNSVDSLFVENQEAGIFRHLGQPGGCPNFCWNLKNALPSSWPCSRAYPSSIANHSILLTSGLLGLPPLVAQERAMKPPI